MSTKTQNTLLPYNDDAAVREVFADSLELLSFNGQFAHLTLTVTRLEETPAGEDQKGIRSTAARIVMSPNLLTNLYNKMSQLVSAMEQNGMVTRSNTDNGAQPASPLDVH